MAKVPQAISEEDVVKDVFNTQGIEAKTELNDEQIMRVNKLKTLSKIVGCDLLEDHLNDFMILQKSRQRKSLSEFVDVFKAKAEHATTRTQNFMQKMFG